MPNQLQKVGAQPSRPPKYGVLWHNNFYLGVVTQRNPLHAFLQHIEEEFYGSQPSLIDGLNTEISTKLTLVRRPGSSVYNSQTFPTINRFYENRTFQYNAAQTVLSENIQVVADTASVVYDATGPSTKATIFTKSSGAGPAFFQSVGNSLYFSDGPDQKKLLTPQFIWAANSKFALGNFILDTNGNLQEVISNSVSLTDNILAVDVINPGLVGVNLVSTLTPPYPITVTFSGLTNVTELNGNTYTPLWFSGNSLAVWGTSLPAYAGPETGHISYVVSKGDTGGSQPTWNTTPGGTTTDNDITWQNMGSPVENWQIAPSDYPPTVVAASGDSFWSPQTYYPQWSALLDTNLNIQIEFSGVGISGVSSPTWNPVPGQLTTDGTLQWFNIGKEQTWIPNYLATNYYTPGTNAGCILDSNGNIQYLSVASGNTGATAPAWMTTLGASTTDSGNTWVCCGPGVVVTTGAWQWSYSYHGLDGSLSTASPIFTISTPILGTSTTPSLTVSGSGTDDPQVDQIWIWRTVQGGSVLFFDGSIPNPGAGTSVATAWTYTDTIPDSAANGGPSLNEFIEAPIADSNNPPPEGLLYLAYHLGCVWGAVGNIVYYSDGPLVTSGNGNTAWNPLNFFQFPSTVFRLVPTSNGLLVFTSSNVYVIQGTNTTGSPLFSTPFLSKYLGLLSYDAFDINGTLLYMYTSDNQIVTLDPSSGISEIGFPIGDQFGPGNGTGTFNPISAHVAWHSSGSQDKALYVSDFQGTWWRMLPTPSPETGTTWCPKAEIVGGFSAVQSVEVIPGMHQLLLGPLTSGPILMRDYSVYADNGTSYLAYTIVGSLVLAQPGQIAIVESLTTDCVATGTPITLAVQLDEISSVTGVSEVSVSGLHVGSGYIPGDIISFSYGGGTGATAEVVTASSPAGHVGTLSLLTVGENYPASGTGVSTSGGSGTGLEINFTNGGYFENLSLYVPDPTQLSPSKSVYAQRFYLSQTQEPAVCRHLQIEVDFGSDTVKNELLSLSLFGNFEQEK